MQITEKKKNETQVYNALRSWFLNAIVHQKNAVPLEKWLIPKLGHRRYKISLEHLPAPQRKKGGASLGVQSLRICLPMQGTRVPALVQEDPTCRRATKELVSHN